MFFVRLQMANMRFRPFVHMETGYFGLTRDTLLQLSPPLAYK